MDAASIRDLAERVDITRRLVKSQQRSQRELGAYLADLEGRLEELASSLAQPPEEAQRHEHPVEAGSRP